MIDRGAFLNSLTRDVDGEARPISGKMDIGADEWYAARQESPDQSAPGEPQYVCAAMAPVGTTIIIEKPEPTKCVIHVKKSWEGRKSGRRRRSTSPAGHLR